jgi:hypothetical protein
VTTPRRVIRLERQYGKLTRQQECKLTPGQVNALFANVETIDAAGALCDAEATFGVESHEYANAMERWIDLGLAAIDSVKDARN